MTDFARRRAQMVERQIAGRGIKDRLVLRAMRTVPRECFVADRLRDVAYDDCPLPIEADQTISQPYIVALMAEAAELRPGDRVLEIGAGSGYAAAVIGQIVRTVFSIERHEELATLAGIRMRQLGYSNVSIVWTDGTLGLPEEAPFDAILAAASGSHVPEVLKRQLAPGGRIVMPLGEPQSVQTLVKLTRLDDRFKSESLGEVRFVPLVGEHGWHEHRSP